VCLLEILLNLSLLRIGRGLVLTVVVALARVPEVFVPCQPISVLTNMYQLVFKDRNPSRSCWVVHAWPEIDVVPARDPSVVFPQVPRNFAVVQIRVVEVNIWNIGSQ